MGGPGGSEDCTGTITDTVADVTCSATISVIPGCTATYTTSIDVTRSGDTYSGTTQFAITYVEDTPVACFGSVD